jgi:hypothetical protein
MVVLTKMVPSIPPPALSNACSMRRSVRKAGQNKRKHGIALCGLKHNTAALQRNKHTQVAAPRPHLVHQHSGCAGRSPSRNNYKQWRPPGPTQCTSTQAVRAVAPQETDIEMHVVCQPSGCPDLSPPYPEILTSGGPQVPHSAPALRLSGPQPHNKQI